MKHRQFSSPQARRVARRFGVSVMCVTMLVTAAFGSGVYWNQLHAQGTPAHARMISPGADEEIGRQALFRMWEDMQSTLEVYESFADADGWKGDQSRIYLKLLRARLGE